VSLTVTQNRPHSAGTLRFHVLAGLLLGTRTPEGTLLDLARHDQVYTSGSLDGYIYVLERGQVKTQVVAASGKRCLLSIYTESDVFGETALLGLARADSAVALSRTVIRRLPVARFRAALTATGLDEAFLGYLSLRLLAQQKIIAGMVTMSSELRLAVRLLDLASQYGRPGPLGVRIEIRFTQEDLAEMVGTTRTRIGQFLKRFRENGLVELTPRSHLLVHQVPLATWIDAHN
jgi:CRP-like cAMP-binding protein